jgi:hypothetical protein
MYAKTVCVYIDIAHTHASSLETIIMCKVWQLYEIKYTYLRKKLSVTKRKKRKPNFNYEIFKWFGLAKQHNMTF